MTRKATVLIWTNALNAVLLVALATTGIILRWVLPPGSGGGMHEGVGRGLGRGMGRVGPGEPATLLDLARHGWGDVHFWIAVAFVAAVLLHLLLHLGWIRNAVSACLIPRHGRTPQRQAA